MAALFRLCRLSTSRFAVKIPGSIRGCCCMNVISGESLVEFQIDKVVYMLSLRVCVLFP